MEYNQCWLNYYPVKDYKDLDLVQNIYLCIEEFQTGIIVDNVRKELMKSLKDILNTSIEWKEVPRNQIGEITCGTIFGLASQEIISDSKMADNLTEEGYLIEQRGQILYVIAKEEKGLLYGAFDLIRTMAMGESLRNLSKFENPKNNFRIINHWDNMTNDIERGYAGESFFFRDNEVIVNERTRDYARIIASVGLNAVVINNVNVKGAATKLITDRYLDKLLEISDIFQGYGIKLYVSANFAAPIELGGLPTADPCDEQVALWWEERVKQVYAKIPGFGGFLIKADSEGRPGPFTYQRTHADGANVLARALKPYGGTLIWRCFVYNCQQDWRDYKTDRARAAYDNFVDLDGQFEDNVILQIKNGPMDFQVREPVSPLFGALKNTNMILEVQAAQEYTGQQKHVCYLIPMWKEILEFNTYAAEQPCTIADIVSGRTYGQPLSGIASVTNTGNDFNWTGHDLAGANLYGFGRLCWDTGLSSERIAEEWVKQTFGQDKQIFEVVMSILTGSWLTYEKYTSPLGIGWMVNPNHHYGPNVDGYEYDKWGTYHRADRNGLGVDRTTKGTGYASQYNEPNASMYENVDTCPEELLLFFHYIRYDYRLKTGKTLIQHIYDTHFEGVEEVENMLAGWASLEGRVAADVYKRVHDRLQIQLESAKEWRDRVNTYFYRKSGADDEKGRKIYY